MAAALLLFVLLTFLLLFVPSYRPLGQVWKGHYTVLLQNDEYFRKFMRLPPSTFEASAFIADKTTFLDYSTFEGLQKVRVGQIESRFDPQDPRIDPYMTGLSTYFRSEHDWIRVFVPSRLPIFHFFTRLYSNLPDYGQRWRIAGYNVFSNVIAVLLSLVFLGILLCYRKDGRLRIWVGLGYVPWLFSLMTGDFHDLIAYFLLFSAWYLVLDDSLDALKQSLFFGWKEPNLGRLRSRYLYMGCAFLVTLLLRAPFSRFDVELLRGFAPLLADFCLAGPFMLVLFYRRWRSGHLVFAPLPIARRYPHVPVRKALVVPIAALLVLSPLLARMARPQASGSVPVPKKLESASQFDWKALDALWNEKAQGDLPNIADYVTHMVYQIGFPYGQAYDLPGENHSFTVSSFREDAANKKISKAISTVALLDAAWLDELLAGPETGTLERMMLDQGTPVRVVLVPLKFFHPVFAWWKFSFLALLVFFVLFTFDFPWTPVLIYSSFRQVYERRWRAA